MSRENVEIVRRAITEFDQSLRPADAFAPDFVWETRTFRGAPGPGEYQGWDGFLEFFREWVDAYDRWEQEPRQVLDAGGDRVVVLAHQRGRLRGTEDWVEMDYALIYTVVDGLIRRIQLYATPGEAFKAAGLAALDGRS